MSSAANHKKRSCRSYSRHASAMRGVARSGALYQMNKMTGRGTLINRLQAFRRRVSEARKKRKAEENAE